MTQNIKQPEEFNVKNIFIGNEYVIPIYQRSYAWEKEEIEQLIIDINDSNSRYYLGSLIVDQIDSNTFSVIDGQQRLTTIFLILSYLESALITDKSLKFEAREKSNRTLKNITLNIEKDESLYSSEILDGFNIIKKYFEMKEASDRNYKDNFKNKLEKILIIRTQVPKKIDLNHYFEIMNTRGEQLEIHEIAKGRFLAIIENQKDREIAASIWDACSQMDSYVQMNIDPQNRDILFGKNWNNFSYTNFNEVRSKFNIAENKEIKFSLKEKLEKPIINFSVNKSEEEENERFESIISFSNLLLVINEAIKNQNNEDDTSLDDKKFIDSLKSHWQNNDSALLFIFSLLKYRFLFDTYIIKREFTKDYKEEGKWSLQKLEKYEYQKGKYTLHKPEYKSTFSNDQLQAYNQQIKTLQSIFRITYTSPKTMHWISKLLIELNNDQNVDLVQILEKYACMKIHFSNYKTSSGFGIDRIIFTYLDYILYRDKLTETVNYEFQFRTSIEHFYPQNPIDSAKDWKVDKNNILNSFGNLALITVSANSKFSNLSPKSKVDSYPEIINQSPKLKLMAKYETWDEKSVKKHEEEMLKILENEIIKHELA